ncbi:hypothetical protein [Salimicrobium halophilum]|uniref:YesK-like protein n=1 Tax=Salimicrobium halophilum TaxID=86666 RepID=A0A1G8RAC7_9BACI|nr:hypothetical protein [Salimicrobium halophilum]SDJ13962.1 hypothetical protein SAMN04490247_0922 [Salimicrobium halophilum]
MDLIVGFLIILVLGAVISFVTIALIPDYRKNRIIAGLIIVLISPVLLLLSFSVLGGGIGAGAIGALVGISILLAGLTTFIVGIFTSDKYKLGALEKEKEKQKELY